MSFGFSNPVKATTQIVVFEQVKSALIAALPESFHEGNVLWSLDPDPDAIVHRLKGLTAALTPLEGQFDQAALDGAAQQVCIEQTGIMIWVWSKQRTDRINDATGLLFGLNDSDARALFELKRKLLKTFTGKMLTDPADGQNILCELMLPQRASTPQFANYDRNLKAADFSLAFSTVFEWDLT